MFDFLKKQPRTVTITSTGQSFTVAPGQKILEAALSAGLSWPHDCRVGSCGSCRCYLRSGKIRPLRDFIYTLEAADIADGAMLACQSLAKSDIEIDIDLDSTVLTTRTQSHTGAIVEIQDVTHDIKEVIVQLDQADIEDAVAGQYAELKVDEVSLPRSYSFARDPSPKTNRLHFYIRHVPGGEFTDWLFAADRTGIDIHVSGPFGNFYRRDGSNPMLLIAGGSGLAPIVALLEQGARERCERDATVFFGARTQADIYAIPELESLAQAWRGQVSIHVVLSDEPDDSPWAGERGLVTDTLRECLRQLSSSAPAQAYLCGPPPMVDAGIAVCVEEGIPREEIFFDRFEDASTNPQIRG